MTKRSSLLALALLCATATVAAHAAPPLAPPKTVATPVPTPKVVTKPPVLSGSVTIGASVVPPDTTVSSHPEVAADGANVYLLLDSQKNDGTNVLTVARSSDGGGRYASPVTVIDHLDYTARPGKIAAKGSTVVATWSTSAGLFYAWSSNNGGTFGAPIRLTTKVEGDYSLRPAIELAFAGDAPVIVWTDTTSQNKAMFARLGATSPTTRALGRSFPSRQPHLGVSGNRVGVAFTEDQNPYYLIAISQSSDGGVTWDSIRTADEGVSGMPYLNTQMTAYIRPAAVGDTAKPIFKAQLVEAVFMTNGGMIVTIPNQDALPQNRALVGIDPAKGLFRGHVAVVEKCAEAAAIVPQPIVPREEAPLNKWNELPLLFADSPSGTEAIWAQGYSSTTTFQSTVWRGRLTGTRLTECRHVVDDKNVYPVAFDGSRLFINTNSEVWLGNVSGGVLSGAWRKGPSTSALGWAFGAYGVAYAYLNGLRSDFRGVPAAGAVH